MRLAASGAPSGPLQFSGITMIQKLSSHDRGVWVMGWLSQESDFSVDDLLAIRELDNDGPALMYEYATQLPPTLRIPQVCMLKAFQYRVSSNRHFACG